MFTQQEDNFFTALVRLGYEIEELDTTPFANVPYDLLFNRKVQPILRTPALQSALADYVTRLNELLDESTFFNRDSFTFYNAANVTKSLGDNGFFTAQHSILLHGDGQDPRRSLARLTSTALIAAEKERITNDDVLRKELEAVEKALNKNADTRAFFDYIAKHVELLPEFTNIDLFEQNLWKSYLKTHEGLYERVVKCFKNAEKRRKEIELPSRCGEHAMGTCHQHLQRPVLRSIPAHCHQSRPRGAGTGESSQSSGSNSRRAPSELLWTAETYWKSSALVRRRRFTSSTYYLKLRHESPPTVKLCSSSMTSRSPSTTRTSTRSSSTLKEMSEQSNFQAHPI